MKSSFNPWPLGIVMAFAIFIGGTAVLVVLACTARSDLVRADYYRQEILHQQQMERVERTLRSAPNARVTYDPACARLKVSLPVFPAFHGAEGRIHLYRPSGANLDRYFPLELDADGQQVLDAADLLPGLWRVRVSWTVDQEEFQLDQRLVIGSRT